MEGKCLITTATRKEQEEEPGRRRAIRPAAVIRFHLNPWTLNDFPRVETACQRCVCDSVCVCEGERKRECVHAYISSSNPSFHRLSTPQYCTLLSLRPISFPLFRLRPATTPLCHRDGYLLFPGDAHNTHFSPSACSFFFFFSFCWPLVSQSACFDLSDWFLDWLSVSPLVGHSDRL